MIGRRSLQIARHLGSRRARPGTGAGKDARAGTDVRAGTGPRAGPGAEAGAGARLTRELVLVRDAGTEEAVWADRLGDLFTSRGHRVRHVDSRVRAAAFGRLVKNVAPGGVVIIGAERDPRPLAGRVPPWLRTVGLRRGPRKPGSPARQVVSWFDATDRFLAPTREEADAWARDGLSNADAMPYPLPVPQQPSPRTEPVIVATGGPDHEHGLDLLLESWAEVAPRHRGWRLWLAGCAAAAAERLRDQAGRLGISAAVTFGEQPVPHAHPLMSASIFALPARTAGYPFGLAEAMAYGLPPVAYSCAPGVRELINDGADGLTVAPGNTREFAVALERLIDDPGLRRDLAVGARESAARFVPEAVADRWDRLFSLLHR